MSLSSIQATILANSKPLEICDTLHDVLIATTEDELIDAGLGLAIHSYNSGIIDDALIAGFTESTLNAHGIYTTGTFTLDNPDEIFIFKDANVTINLDGTNKSKINALGACVITIVAGDDSYAYAVGYGNASFNVTINDNAIVKLDLQKSNVAGITANDSGVLHTTQKNESLINLTANGNSYTLAKLFNTAVLNYLVNDTAIVNPTTYNSSTATAGALP